MNLNLRKFQHISNYSKYTNYYRFFRENRSILHTTKGNLTITNTHKDEFLVSILKILQIMIIIILISESKLQCIAYC